MGTTDKGSGVYRMTPEQKANLKNFGKKNGLSAEKVQAQLAPNQTPPVQPQQTIQPPAAPVVQQQEQQVQHVDVAPNATRVSQPKIQECDTYFSYEDDGGGSLEVDLITFREKGIETRYLSLLFSGMDVRQNPPTPQQAYLNIESKEEFERFKAFFAQLDWED